MVNDNLLRDTELCDYLIKNEKGNNYSIIVRCQHSFDPLSKVFYCYDDIKNPLAKIQVTCSEGNKNNDWKHRRRVCPHLPTKDLARVALLDCLNTILD
jgi:hypothetical protein